MLTYKSKLNQINLKMEFNLTIIILTAIVVFCISIGAFGYLIRKSYKNIFFNLLFLLIFTIILTYLLDYYSCIDYLLDKDLENKLINASQASSGLQVHNPNLNISANVANALGSVGIGAAVGTGMAAGAKIAKTTSLPVSGKLGILIASGVSAGVIAVGSSAVLNIINSKNSTKPNSNSGQNNFPAKSVDEDFDFDLENIMTLFNAEYILNIIIVYLLIMLLMLYIIDIAIKNQSEFVFVKKLLSYNAYNKFMKAIRFIHKSNKLFILITWISLFICSISSLLFFHVIASNIDFISEVICSKK